MSRRRLPNIAALAIVVVVVATGCTVFSSKPHITPGPTSEPVPTSTGPSPTYAPGTCSTTPLAAATARPSGPPDATPLASPPAAPAGDGTCATIVTSLGTIVIEIYNESAPVASENFVNLASAGFYNGLTFHRIVPGFVIQGGDPAGDGSGGPGYAIPDEPVVGDYLRGVVAMARTSAPNSQGSQFFICLDDLRTQLDKSGGYVIFGNVVSGMDVVDAIAAVQTDSNQLPLQPVTMTSVTVTRP